MLEIDADELEEFECSIKQFEDRLRTSVSMRKFGFEGEMKSERNFEI